MVFIVKTVGIYKMSILATDRSRPIVHFLNKRLNRAAYGFCENLTGIAGRMYHSQIQKLFNSNRVADFKTCNLRSRSVKAFDSIS